MTQKDLFLKGKIDKLDHIAIVKFGTTKYVCTGKVALTHSLRLPDPFQAQHVCRL